MGHTSSFPWLDGRYGNISLFSYISVLKYELSVLYVTDVLRDPRGVNFRIAAKVQQQGSALDFLVSLYDDFADLLLS